jgi:3-methyladenine DNA glycosylase AlkD
MATRPSGQSSTSTRAPDVNCVLAALGDLSTESTLAGMVRFGIPSTHALGVTMADMRTLAKSLGQSHELAADLWATGCYEARMVASMIEAPALVTPIQMDQWCRDFDSWAICDTVCFNLFNVTAHAWEKIHEWSSREAEFEKRAAYALLWCLPRRKASADNAAFIAALGLIEREACDERNFVKKAVNMALRSIGKRNTELNAAAIETARRLAVANNKTSRWIGSHALRELASPAVVSRLAKR